MAGGTGGHVFPALAVAQQLIDLGQQVEWLGSQRGIETEVVPKNNIPLTKISISGLRGKGVLALIMAPVKLTIALYQALRAILKIRPDCVLGMGGFASGPGGLAAWITRRPLIIHEQNAIAGITNRILRAFASSVLEGFENAFAKQHGTLSVGNPVRKEIVNIMPPAERFLLREKPIRLLILGGSLGARGLNQVVPAALEKLAEEERPDVWHQTGKTLHKETVELYSEAHLKARVEPFIERMETAYEWADLVVCRAGALTVSELACAGLASILVPYPYAVDDHQTKNAEYLERAGAAVLVQQEQLTAANLAEMLSGKFSDLGVLGEMAGRARKCGKNDAAERVANICLEIAHG